MTRPLRSLVALAAATVAACGGSAPVDPGPTVTVRQDAETGAPASTGTPRPEPPSDVALLQALVRDRGKALARGDAAALAAAAGRRQARRDAVTLRAIRRLGLRDVSLTIEDLEVSSSTATAQAALEYRFPGIRGRFRHLRRLTADKGLDGRWRLLRDRPARRESYPWEVADLAVLRTPHFTVLHPRTLDPRDLPRILEQGYATLRAELRARLARRYLVLIGADPGEAEDLTSGILGLDDLAAVADSDVRERGETRAVQEVVAQRLVLVWSNFAGLEAAARIRLVTHELVHLALAERTSGRAPSWLVEGVALYVSGDRRAVPADAPGLAALSRPRAIARLAGPPQAAAYAVASAAAFVIADRFGRRRLLALYDAFNDPSLDAPDAAALTDAAVRRVLGISLTRLDALVARA